MKLVDIISNGAVGRYMLVEPACDPAAPAFAKWTGLIVEKRENGAIKVRNPRGTRYDSGDLLNLSGLAVRSEWTYLREGEM